MRYRLKVPDDIAALVRSLHPRIKAHIKTALQTLLEDPCRGKSLRDELLGLRSYRTKRYRIIYRINEREKLLEIVAIGPRRNIYEETFKIIQKEERDKHD